jgi:DNA-binding transcriptional regulator GbsR (MarR family)
MGVEFDPPIGSVPSPSCLEPSAQIAPLTDFEVGVIDLFVGATRLVGLPKSVGEIYGLLYISPNPVCLDDLVARLQISKGSASQGLRFLRNLGAVKQIYVPGERRDHYVAQAELKKLVGGLLNEEIKPHVDAGSDRLNALEAMLKVEDAGDQEFYAERVKRLRNWQSRASKLIRVMKTFLGESPL